MQSGIFEIFYTYTFIHTYIRTFSIMSTQTKL